MINQENTSEVLNIPRANGAKRRSGRKPGARVTNRALGKLKVVHGRRVVISLISKIWRTIKMLKIYLMQIFCFLHQNV